MIMVLWCVALLQSLVLLVAAYGKMFYPTEDLGRLDFGVSVFEVGLVANLILYRRYWQMWTLLALVFATWGGYSFFWYQTELPCSCMGESLDLPNGFSLVINIIFYCMSVGCATMLGAPRMIWWCLLSAILATMGFFIASRIYQAVVV